MPYQGIVGVRTVFPMADGSPAKPRRARAEAPRQPRARRPRKRRPLKVPKTISYPRLTSKNPIRAPSATEAALGALGARRALAAAKGFAKGVVEAGGKTPLTAGRKLLVPRAVAARALGVAGIAGAVAYGLTRAGLAQIAKKRATLAENAHRLADAYRFARVKMAEDQGRPLTKTQLKQFSVAFKNELLKLGLSTSDLSKLNRNFFSDY